ncbi:MAG TPA: flagellar export chaperone FliS [Clostridia bacterium]|jgi:flagellar protein FliS|nr:flagellar export chaperone FliS [Clostridia bacterium]HXK71484.1 flagellar export chaperone FliS [Clostridia bacterium]
MKQENILKEYSDNNILQSTPEGLILLLYNKCISNIEAAKYYNGKKNIEKTNKYLQKSQDILYYLQSTLDNKFEISKQLSTMYDFIINQLTVANIKKDSEKMSIALDFTIQMRNLWVEVTEENRKYKSKAV